MDVNNEKGRVGDAPQKENKNSYKSPLIKPVPNIFSRTFFCWLWLPLFNSMSRDLEEYDLVPAKHQFDSKRVGDRLEKYWLIEVDSAKAKGREPSFSKALVKSFWMSLVPGAICQCLSVFIRTLTPLLFAELITFWSVNTTMSKERASMYAGCILMCNWIGAFFIHHANLHCQQVGMQLRIASSSLIFRKIMRMNNSALHDATTGKIVNLLSNDLERFDLALLYLNYAWIVPLQLALVCYMGYRQAGYAAIIGLTILLFIMFPVQGIAKSLGKVRLKMAQKTDDRLKIMTEVISGIQVIKMYAWEIPFQKIVSERRNNELKYIRSGSILRTIFRGLILFTERTVLFVTISFYIVFGNTMKANVIYPLQQFISIAQLYVSMTLPLLITHMSELIVSLKRIQQFLVLEDSHDLSKNTVSPLYNIFSCSSKPEKSDELVRLISYQRKCDNFADNGLSLKRTRFRRSLSHLEDSTAVKFQNVSASWTNDDEKFTLKNISLRIRRGKLYAIIGAVGSGKSSLLQMLLKELPAYAGSVSVNGSCSYASQDAWLFPSTVRQNIVFGLPFDADKYKQVCNACCLEKDFKQFPFGDQSFVGERGVSLSGGQRARVNLARCMYREADIYLLDDPLSAVDANVGRLLFEGCINGHLRGRTRVLVTHQLHFLKAADYIIILNEGRIENMGTFDELVKSEKEFSAIFASLHEGKDRDASGATSGVIAKDNDKRVNKQRLSLTRVSESDDIEEFEAQKLQAEERQSGDLKWTVLLTYFRSGGSGYFIFFTVGMILIGALFGGAVDYWVSFWFNNISKYEKSLHGGESEPGLHVREGPLTRAQYLMVQGGLILVCIITVNLRIIPFAKLVVNASKNLHDYMFSTILRGVTRFFHTSSTGSILNRFAKDMGAVDEVLPRSLLEVLQIYSLLCSVLILNALALYWTLIPSLMLLLIFASLIRFYLKIAQSMKRLEGTAKSPVLGMVSSTLNGIATIRSADAQKRLAEEFDNYQDLHTAAFNGYLTGSFCFGLFLDSVCIIYQSIIIFVFIYIDFGDVIAVGSVGLAITQTNTLTTMLQYGSRMLVEFIAQLTSVERVLDYTRIETEDNLHQGKMASPEAWLSAGRIVFERVSMRYAPDQPLVLKDLNIIVESGWKVGIVGRTGAGKSSLIQAMFRFTFLEGKIAIDGLDTSLISRQELRSKISIIPQEPVLFSATIRYNLDPSNLYSDADIWQALEQVDMKSAIPSLDHKVTEGGSNFSVGQRQLMCLARAMLRLNKILIMDEATANVDPQTDNFIQQTIKEHFASCTVLTIAHRLNTIMESDRVLVMSFGQVVEYDHPYILLSDPNSHFSSMVRETGKKNAEQLFQVAKDAYFLSNLKDRFE